MMHRASLAKNKCLNCDYFLIHQFIHMFCVLKEPSHQDGSFEYPQHMFRLRNKKNNFQLRTLIWGPDDACLC